MEHSKQRAVKGSSPGYGRNGLVGKRKHNQIYWGRPQSTTVTFLLVLPFLDPKRSTAVTASTSLAW